MRIDPGTSGRWVRRGREIVLLPGGGPPGEMEAETGPIPATPQGVIHPAIDVHAQYALMRMSRGDAGAQADAWGMLGAARGGRLGIYKVDQLKPAQRAQTLGAHWWTVIPTGEDAAVLMDPAGTEPPFIVFRDAVKNDAARLDPALRRAWRTFGMLGRCTIPALGGPIADVLPGSLVPTNLVPRLLCAGPGTTTARLAPPRGLSLLTHFHRGNSSTQPAVIRCLRGPVEVMRREAMNPGFIHPDTGQAIKASGSGSLQEKLVASITRLFPGQTGQVSAAVVDLTGTSICAPVFAGWRETVNFEAGSLAKICALYAVFQLRFDLETMAQRLRITSPAVLVQAARSAWQNAGLPENEQPAVQYLFELSAGGGNPVRVEPSARLQGLLACTLTDNCNWTASILINRIGLPYISSALWTAGLLDNRVGGGLWLRSGYCGGPDAADCDRRTTHCPERPDDLNCRRIEALRTTRSFGAELGLASHNATALSVAAFYTLIAQKRLPDADAGRRMETALAGACSKFQPWLLPCLTRRLAKCGFTRVGTSELHHDGALVERWTNTGCEQGPMRTGLMRYVVVLLTNGVPGVANRFLELIKDMDKAVMDANGLPLPVQPLPEPVRRPPSRLRLPRR